MITSSSEIGLFDVAQLWSGRQTIIQGDSSASMPGRSVGAADSEAKRRALEAQEAIVSIHVAVDQKSAP